MSAVYPKLPKVNDVAIESKFLSTDEHSVLLSWAEDEFSHGRLKTNPSGPFRYFNRYEKGDSVPDVFWEVRQRTISNFSITDYEDEPKFRCFLGCNTEGGFVGRHTDSAPPDKHHIRMNIMVSKPLRGGIPFVNGKTIDIEERDMWCFFPAIMPHASSPVLGNRNRFVLSIGILVPRNSVP